MEDALIGRDLDDFMAVVARATIIADRVTPAVPEGITSNPSDDHRPSFMIPSKK
jgi:hypothetical protein